MRNAVAWSVDAVKSVAIPAAQSRLWSSAQSWFRLNEDAAGSAKRGFTEHDQRGGVG